MSNHNSVSKMHGESTALVPSKIYFIPFFFFLTVSEVKVLECVNDILETVPHAVYFIVSIMMFSTENNCFPPLFSIIVMFLDILGNLDIPLDIVVEILLFILLPFLLSVIFAQ